ncbi:MAG TPA: hypothetical protein VFT70_01115 [Nocardioides sp.]|nr:hypothetical protein [Nocardioides sp.]
MNADADLVRRGRYVSTTFLIGADDTSWLVGVDEGRIRVAEGPFVMPRWRFALRASASTWERFWQPDPGPGWHDVMALVKFRRLVAEGDLHPFMANLLWFKDVLAAPRALHAVAAGAAR